MPTRLVFEEVVVADARIREASNERRLVAHRATIDGVVVQLLPALRWRAMRFTAQPLSHKRMLYVWWAAASGLG